MRILLASAALIPIFGISSSFAFVQQDTKPTAQELKAKWESLSPEERDKLKAEYKEKAQEKWNAMTPDERAAKKAEIKEKIKNMSPERKAQVKEKIKEHREKK